MKHYDKVIFPFILLPVSNLWTRRIYIIFNNRIITVTILYKLNLYFNAYSVRA